MNKTRKLWSTLFLGAAMGGLLLTAGSATAALPNPAAPVQGEAAEAQKLIAEAQAAYKGGNARLALIQLRKAVRQAPDYGPAHFQLAMLLMAGDDQGGAERELRLALKTGVPEKTVLPYLFQVMLLRQEFQDLLTQFPDPGATNSPVAPDILKARAFALQRLGRAAEAVEAADRGLKLRRDGIGLLARGGLALQQGDRALALQLANEAQKLAPNNAEVGLFKLRMLRLTQDNAGALALGDQLLAKYPGNLEIQFAHIELLLAQSQFPKAKAEVDALLAKRPGLQMGKYYKALLLARSGDAKGAWDLALTLPKEFLEAAPGAGLAVAQMAVDVGRRDVAAATLGRVLGRDPGNVPARRRLAAIYMDQGNANSALTALNPVKDASDPEVMRLLVRIYDDLDRPKDAAAIRAKLAGVGGSEDQDIRRKAFAAMAAGRMDQAITDLKTAVAKDPVNPSLTAPLIAALVQARRYPEALAVADRLAQDPKQRVNGLVQRGAVLLLQRKLPEAQAAFDKAVALEPKNAAALLARANFFSASQKYDDANTDLRAILASDPKNMVARIRLADIAARQGKDQDTRRLLGEAIAQSQDAAPRIALIRYLMARKDHKAALQTADELVRLQPANTDGVMLRGQSQSVLGQKQEAVASFRSLVSLAPKAAQSHLLLSNALLTSGDRAGAQRALDDAGKLAIDSPALKAAQVGLQFAVGNADKAVASARDFRASHPGAQADILLADTLTKAKRYDQAADILGKSLAAKPDQLILSRLVQLKILMNDKKGAADLMSQWLARNPGDISVRQILAMQLMTERDNAGARAQYEAILKQDAANVVAMNNLGGLLQASDPGRAGALFAKALQIAPNSPEIMDSLGWFKVQQKDAAGGLPLLQRAHDLQPQNGAITYHLVVALEATAKRDAARALLKTLLASGAKFDELPDARRLAATWK